jgi:hypothetical protein
MALLRRWLLIFSALVLGGGQLLAASREERAFAAATAAFQDQNWDRAETQFAQFVQRFPKSDKVPTAVLSEAQAQFKQGKYVAAAALLSPRAAGAGGLADAYTYWLGEAQFAAGDFTNAAETFSVVAKNFPESPLRLTAVVEAAAAYARFPDWTRHDALLEARRSLTRTTRWSSTAVFRWRNRSWRRAISPPPENFWRCSIPKSSRRNGTGNG